MIQVEQLNKTLKALGTGDSFKDAKFSAESGFHSEANLEYLETTGLDCYIADTGFRSRNPLFQDSETYQKEKDKHYRKRHSGKSKRFTDDDFMFDKEALTCRCPANNLVWLSSRKTTINGQVYYRFEGRITDCKQCPIQKGCMRNSPTSHGRQVASSYDIQDEFISYTQRMKKKIDSGSGRRQYSKWLGIIEPVFGNNTTNKGNRFTLRGQEKVNTRWQMYCRVHNIEKLRHSLH